MDIRITPSNLRGTVAALSSKSDVHRALICAAFSEKATRIFCNVRSKDIEATARCLRTAGARINFSEENEIFVEPVRPESARQMATLGKEACKTDEPLKAAHAQRTAEASERREPPLLDCGESGSTLRFLLPVMGAFGKSVRFCGSGELPNRPLSALTSAMSAHGIRFSAEKLPFCISGRLSGGRFYLPGDISSQYITGLLLGFPLLHGQAPAEIVLTSRLQSAGYVDMTLDTMSRFGAAAERTETGFRFAGGNGYRSPGDYEADGDWSGAAFWLCAGRMRGNEILVTGLREASLQGDRAVSELVSGWEREHRRIDASGIPDLVPALSALSAVSGGTTEIVHAERVRLKECDRLSAIAKEFGKLGVSISERADGLFIRGCERPAGGVTLDGHNDHRIVMAEAVLASACEKDCVITGAEAVEKSYPHFFADFRKLGGIADVI